MSVVRDRQPFEGSPFVLMATPKIGECWAGRKEVLRQLTRIVRTLVTRSESTFDLIWANFGAGKTHALFHIAHLLEAHSDRVIPVFVEIPESTRHFIDLYRRVVTALPWSRVANMICNSQSNISSELKSCARVLVHGAPLERHVAMDWIAAGRPHLRELRTCTGISTRIETDIYATDCLSDIVQVLASHRCRLVLLLDEFQRLGVLHGKFRLAILSSLRSLFSRNPSYFSVIVAATTRVERTAVDLIPQELRTLMGMRPSISLPEMTGDEAYEFVLERFKCFRPPDYSGGPDEPIGDEGIRATIAFISSEKISARLIPRTVLQALAWIGDETEHDEHPVTAARVTEILGELSWDRVDEQSDN